MDRIWTGGNLLLLLSAGLLLYSVRGLKKEIHLEGRNASHLKDGRYRGRYQGGRWSNDVEVVVQNGEMKDITVVKDGLFPRPDVARKLFPSILERQRTDVDAVSGATLTSRAYLRAVEDALDPKHKVAR